MYSDLLDVLGGGQNVARSATPREPEKHVATSFKAGKMNLEPRDNESKYWVTPDTRRGTVQLVWTSNQLKWEWKSRRDDTVVDSFPVTRGATFERVEASPTGRVFLLSEPRSMFWMQDASEEKDDEIVVQVNQYLTNPEEAKPDAATGDDVLAQAMQNSTSSDTTTTTPNNNHQVDALSNILENLGMPQQQQQQNTSTATTTTTAAPTGTLTLADLQGAMSGLAAASSPTTTTVGPPLQEVVTAQAITSLLQDEAVCTRLMELLPEHQRSFQHLEENLRSPQIQQTLRSLTAALQPDDVGNMDGYHSVLANFNLDPKDGEEALLRTSGNPIQAFLDCVLASVETNEEEEETKEEEEPKEEEEHKEDAMEE